SPPPRSRGTWKRRHVGRLLEFARYQLQIRVSSTISEDELDRLCVAVETLMEDTVNEMTTKLKELEPTFQLDLSW
ncbi:MAG TPA: hypothetical protein VGO86_16965, partial [Candidatus Dormibacteraeota bacterium]